MLQIGYLKNLITNFLHAIGKKMIVKGFRTVAFVESTPRYVLEYNYQENVSKFWDYLPMLLCV